MQSHKGHIWDTLAGRTVHMSCIWLLFAISAILVRSGVSHVISIMLPFKIAPDAV